MWVNITLGVCLLGQVITFVSGKGGTGKSSLCAAIATALAQQGLRVLCIDGDIGMRNLDIYLGLSQGNALSFVDVCSGYYPLSAALCHPQFPTLSFLTAPTNGSIDDVPIEKFRETIQAARWQFDHILIDGPSGIGPGMTAMVSVCDQCILTALPDPASIRCAERIGQELEKLGVKDTRMVLNRVYKDLLKALDMNVDDVMDAVGLPLLGMVPSDLNISLAASRGKPLLLYSRLGAAPACKRIAKRLQGQPVPVANR